MALFVALLEAESHSVEASGGANIEIVQWSSQVSYFVTAEEKRAYSWFSEKILEYYPEKNGWSNHRIKMITSIPREVLKSALE